VGAALPSIIESLDATARSAPGRAAVIDHGVAISYDDLALRSRGWASWLLCQGIAPGMRVGLTLRDEMMHLLASLALLRLGCTQVTLASHEPIGQRADLAARLRLPVLLAGDEDDAPEGVAPLRPDAEAIAAVPPATLPAVPEGGFVFASSGTTGRPKLVPMPARILAAQAALTAGYGRVRHRQATNEFANGKRLQMQTLWIGGTEVLANNGAGRSLAATCATFGVERLNLSPQRAALLAAEASRPGADPWPEGTAIMISGGPVPGPLRTELQARLTRQVMVNLGCTEAGGIAIAMPGDHAIHPDTVGFPFPGTELRIADEDGRALPRGERGFVRLRSPGCVEGYLDDPEATARAFRDGWFIPGDVGHLTPEGALVLAGRGDDMMNLGTIKIFPAEIEAMAREFPGVADCAAFALRSRAVGDIPMLAVVPADGFDAAALLALGRARLGLRAPRKVITLPALPRNPAGKVLRRELAAMARGAA
jgi:acyl-CoA synthetase (AMP-forming)/AMP-acid ligase II